MQEDVEVIAARKRKEEDEPVDIDGVNEAVSTDQNGTLDEDLAWADEEADEDTENWKLKTIMKDEYDM
jgi:COMPASS component SWD1